MNAPETAPSGAFSAPPPEPTPEPQIGNSRFNLGPARAVDRPEPVEQVEAIPDLVIRPPRQRSSLPAVIEARPKSRLPIRIAIAVIVLALVAGAGSVGYLFLDDILPMVPMAWRTMLHLAP